MKWSIFWTTLMKSHGGFLGDGKNRRRVVSKAKGREPFEHNPKQPNSNSMIRAYLAKDVMTKEEFENY